MRGKSFSISTNIRSGRQVRCKVTLYGHAFYKGDLNVNTVKPRKDYILKQFSYSESIPTIHRTSNHHGLKDHLFQTVANIIATDCRKRWESLQSPRARSRKWLVLFITTLYNFELSFLTFNTVHLSPRHQYFTPICKLKKIFQDFK